MGWVIVYMKGVAYISFLAKGWLMVARSLSNGLYCLIGFVSVLAVCLGGGLVVP